MKERPSITSVLVKIVFLLLCSDKHANGCRRKSLWKKHTTQFNARLFSLNFFAIFCAKKKRARGVPYTIFLRLREKKEGATHTSRLRYSVSPKKTRDTKAKQRVRLRKREQKNDTTRLRRLFLSANLKVIKSEVDPPHTHTHAKTVTDATDINSKKE